MGENIPKHGHGKKLPELVYQRDNCIRIEFFRPIRKLNSKKALHHIVLNIFNYFLAVRTVGEHTNHAAHRRVRIIEKSERREAKHVLQTRRPVCAELPLHNFNKPLRHLVLQFQRDFLERIERDRPLAVSRVNQDNVVNPILWNKIKNRLNDVAVRIDKTKPLAVHDILAHQKLEEF